jgi:hypothetical protein
MPAPCPFLTSLVLIRSNVISSPNRDKSSTGRLIQVMLPRRDVSSKGLIVYGKKHLIPFVQGQIGWIYSMHIVMALSSIPYLPFCPSTLRACSLLTLSVLLFAFLLRSLTPAPFFLSSCLPALFSPSTVYPLKHSLYPFPPETYLSSYGRFLLLNIAKNFPQIVHLCS